MNYRVAEDAKPQMYMLLVAVGVSIALWLISWFIPFTSYLVYPLQLFATFVHEGSHVLAAVLTGSEVQSLSVSPDASGVVWSVPSGWLAALLISSAGYLGTTAFGTALLVWIRYGFSSQKALYFAAGFVGIMTFVFGLLFPLWNIFSPNVSLGSMVFTILSGAVLMGGLFALAKYGSAKWINFALSFLAVQCLLNAFSSIKDLFLISATTNMHTDAANMAAATGIPSLVWVLLWLGISVLMISIGLRLYAVSFKKSNSDLPFQD